MELNFIPSTHIDYAWAIGASCLAASIDGVEEIMPGQLKMILSRGERQLIQVSDNGETVAWVVFRFDQLPNMRVAHLTNVTAVKPGLKNVMEIAKRAAAEHGCSEMRISCKPAQSRLFKRYGFEPVYETLRIQTWQQI